MPYLPPAATEDTTLPPPLGADFYLQVRMIEEKWRRFFPDLTYTPIATATTVDATADASAPVGEPGTTAWDPLWGEAIDAAARDTLGAWDQPQGSGVLSAPDPEVYLDPVQIRARVRVEASDQDLHEYGFEKLIDLMVEVPASLFDAAGVTAREGDLIDWGGGQYVVKKVGFAARFKNTSTALYVGLNCQTRRRGS